MWYVGGKKTDYLRAPLKFNFPSVHQLLVCVSVCLWGEERSARVWALSGCPSVQGSLCLCEQGPCLALRCLAMAHRAPGTPWVATESVPLPEGSRTASPTASGLLSLLQQHLPGPKASLSISPSHFLLPLFHSPLVTHFPHTPQGLLPARPLRT
ncbi:hypothetical protein MC885_016119, partial [Smutsia gigantea]